MNVDKKKGTGLLRCPGASKVLPSRGDATLENSHGRLSDEFGLELTRPNRVKLEKFAPCLQMPFPGWTILISLGLLMVLPFLKPWKSLHAELAGYFKEPHCQGAALDIRRNLCHAPPRAHGVLRGKQCASVAQLVRAVDS
jgi:hypothetical protein